MTLEKDEFVKQWLFRAAEDIDVIDSLFHAKTGKFNSTICFHAQQAVEKYLKAFLVFKDVDFPKTHDVDFLLIKCREILPMEFNVNLRNLNEFSVSIRYPDDFYIPVAQEVKYYRSVANEIRQIVLRQLGARFEPI